MKAWEEVEAKVGARQALGAGEYTAMLQGGVLVQLVRLSQTLDILVPTVRYFSTKLVALPISPLSTLLQF